MAFSLIKYNTKIANSIRATRGNNILYSVWDFFQHYKAEPLAQLLALARTNISRLLAGETPRLIDEWQMATQFWDAVRNEVDSLAERQIWADRGENRRECLRVSANLPTSAKMVCSLCRQAV